MLRHHLHKYNGLMCIFVGTVVAFGTHKRTDEPTVLLIDIKCISIPDVELTHTWCLQNDKFNISNLKRGLIIEFEAVISPYGKGEKDKHGKSRYKDYGLSDPVKIRNVGRNRKYNAVEALPPSNRINVKDIMNIERSNIPQIKL